MIKDLNNNMVHLMKMLMLWKSSGTFIPVVKRAWAMLQEHSYKYFLLLSLKSTEVIAIKERNVAGA
jgi:hypothetical protein